MPVSAFDPAVRMALAPFSRRNRAVKEILLKGFASPSNFYYTRAWIQMQDFIAEFNYCRETTVSPTRGTDRGPFQSRPKVPIQKLSPSRSQKSVIHAPAFLAFAQQMLFHARFRAKHLEIPVK